MEKTGLFDFLAFMVPGGALASLLYLYITPLFPFLDTHDINAFVLLPALIMLFYFLGHLISKTGAYLEKLLPDLPGYFVHHLNKQDQAVLKKIEDYFATSYGLKATKIIDGTATPPSLEINPESDMRLYTYSFHLLEYSGKMEKIKILQAQQRFFRNSLVLFILLVLLQIFTTGHYLFQYNCEDWIWPPSILVLCFSVAGIFACNFFRKEREKHMMVSIGNLLVIHVCEPKVSK
ncbi:MAG: hypothetical protein IPL92_13670 [Saprospiraceae bacterium]|nr:hypothetical protein [Candidatus Opimibacter iunctus]